MEDYTVSFQSNSSVRFALRFCSFNVGGFLVVKLRLRDNENVNDAVKRFRKLVEHAGIKKEMRKREFFEKPSDERRRNRRRAQMRARRAQTQPVIGQ